MEKGASYVNKSAEMRYQHLSPAMLADAVNNLDVLAEKARHQGVTKPKF